MIPFKIRCSAIGQIMTNSRKKGELSKTTQSYLDLWIKEKIYDRRKRIKSKYLDKGNMCENDSIKFISQYLGMKGLAKNEMFFTDEYMTGTPDLIIKGEDLKFADSDLVIDVKNSWDFSTFPLFCDDVPNKDYYYQAQGYMNLTGAKHYKLIYTLMNTPESLIRRDYKFSDAVDYDELAEDELAEDYSYNAFAKDYNYDNIDNKHRIKVFDIKRDDEVIEQINQRVIECRGYIDNILKDL
jgi:hypothetical protein